MLRYLVIIFSFIWAPLVSAQNDQLAKNYFEQGAFEKAALTYESLLKMQPQNTNYISALVATYQQLEEYDKAQKILENTFNWNIPVPHLEIELGYNYQLQGDTTKAQEYYQKAISSLQNNPNYAYAIGRAFEKYALLDQAVQVYTQAMGTNNKLMFDLQLARIYAEQGQIEKMLDTYINLIQQDEKYYPTAQRTFTQFITADPENDANKAFKKLLLKKSQTAPDLLYNRLLSWLFIQQKEYRKAFIQEKAIYKRANTDLQDILNLVGIALEENEFEVSQDILEFIIDSSPSTDIILLAHQKLIQLKLANATPTALTAIEGDFIELLNTYGKTPQTLSLQLDYAHYLAFYLTKKEEAITYLENTLDLSLSRFEEARTKMKLADIYVLDERFSSALIYYSQIQRTIKNDVLAQEARFKVAKTSYYKGDFEWAKTQLKVLKASTTQLIANDAQQLFILITDNSLEDSTQTALKKFARADLLAYQKKPQQAIAIYDSILNNHKGESIEDEALLAQAQLYRSASNFTKAEANYLKIISYYRDDILADDAYFNLAELYLYHLNDEQKAKQYYEQIIFDFADSIYYVEAQKKYRSLRGDVIN